MKILLFAFGVLIVATALAAPFVIVWYIWGVMRASRNTDIERRAIALDELQHPIERAHQPAYVPLSERRQPVVERADERAKTRAYLAQQARDRGETL